MKKIAGYLYKGLGKFLELLTTALIFLLELVVMLLDSVKKLLGFFTILFIFILFNPLLWTFIILHPVILLVIIVLFIVPLLGRGLISYLKYIQYILTEYFYDKADYYLLGKDNRRQSFDSYKNEYFRQQEEARQRESQRRAEQTQRMWEEMFRDFYENMNNQGYGSGYYESYNNNQSYNQGGFYNPTNDFISKYEESCKILELEPTVDKYEIKLAYRKMAKKYHPDINKAANATEVFQKINEANEFLSEENIERYKRLKNIN